MMSLFLKMEDGTS